MEPFLCSVFFSGALSFKLADSEWTVFVTVDGVVELFGVTPVSVAAFLLSNFVVDVLLHYQILAVSVLREIDFRGCIV